MSVRARFPNTLANSASSNEQSRLFSTVVGGFHRLGGKKEGVERGGRREGSGGREVLLKESRVDESLRIGQTDGLRWARNLTSSERKQASRPRPHETSANEHNVCHIAHSIGIIQQQPTLHNE